MRCRRRNRAAYGIGCSVSRDVHGSGSRSGRGGVTFKPVPTPRHGPDQALAIVPERTSQFADALHQGIVSDDEIAPDGRKQLLLRNQAVGVLDEVLQDRERLGPKLDLLPVEQEAAAIQVQHVAIELQLLGRHLRWIVRLEGDHYAVPAPQATGVEWVPCSGALPPRSHQDNEGDVVRHQ